MEANLIFFGIQGSGKGTQAKELLKLVGDKYAYFSSGDVFRALLGTENAIGSYLKERLESGNLIADDVTIAIFETFFATVLDTGKLMLLDGYPRTKKQVDKLLDKMDQYGKTISAVYFDLSEQEAIKRMKLRGRADDNEEGIKKRIEEYKTKTLPIIEYFAQKGDLIKINADQTVEEVFAELREKLGV